MSQPSLVPVHAAPMEDDDDLPPAPAARHPLERILDTLEARDARPKRNGRGWLARCPAHDDSRPSLSVTEGDDGRVLLHCHAGCDSEAVIAAISMEARDLFPSGNGSKTRIVATYPYHDERGALLFETVRFTPKDFRQRRPDGAGGSIWSLKGTRRVLFRLPQILAAVKAGRTIYVVEGEKDVEALVRAGVDATCNPMGAGKWRREYSETLRGAPVRIVRDRDAAGEKHARAVAASLEGIAASVKIVEAREGKDAADHLAAGFGVEELVEVPAVEDDPLPPPTAEPEGNEDRHRPTIAMGADQPAFEIRSELGNAEEIVRQHGADLRHVVSWGKWLAWDGARWKLDASGEARRRAKQTARARTLRAVEAGDEKGVKFAIRSEAARGIEAALSLAATQAQIALEPTALDRDPFTLNTLAGTLDLRSGELRPHRREDLITKLAPVVYDRAATAPTWDAFLARVLPDPEVREFVQRFLGYALTGDVSEQVIAFAYGIGANGKSTLLTSVQRFLGDYAVSCPTDLLLASRNTQHPTGLTTLFGRRLAVAMESGEGRALAEALVKMLTGGDRIPARRMREDFWEFDATHKIVLAANHRPEIRGTDLAIWRRILLVPFSVVIPEAERDRKLPDKLAAEAPGILAWMVRGCLDWQQHGLRPPRAVRAATKAYREDQDLIGAFLEDRCTINLALKAQIYVGKGELHAAYLEWAREQKESDPLAMRSFGERMRERGFEEDRHGTERTRIWRGVGLRAPAGEREVP